MASLPIIDISPFLPTSTATEAERDETAKKLYSACHNVGFFYLTGHGIPDETLKAVLDAAREFFTGSSEKEKTAIARKEVGDGGDGARGYQRLGTVWPLLSPSDAS